MIEIKDKQLQYYCNNIGELHECGQRMLDSVEELPQALQRPYQELWTEGWSLFCYVVFLDKQPGMLICAEYDADYCLSQGIPVEYDLQYPLLYHYGERLEKLAHEIDPHATVGLSYDSSCDPQLMLFIPTETVSLQNTLKLYYLIDQFGFQKAPDAVRWSVQELTAFAKRLHLAPEIEQQMLDGLDSEVELGDHRDARNLAQHIPAKRYVDKQGNLYFVRSGIGKVYKGFRRYADPKPRQRRESGIRSLKYVKDIGLAQLALDQYAEQHKLRLVTEQGDKDGKQ